jgi:ABC-type transport system substrate-binding protein
VYREAVVAAQRPISLDPLFGRDDQAVRDVGTLLYRGLLRLDGRALPAPDLAESWGTSGDGLAYRFALRAGLRWSDGSRLTARDVAATVAVVQSPGYPDRTTAVAWNAVKVTTDGDGIVTLTLPAPRASFAAAAAELPVLPAAPLLGRTPDQLRLGAAQPLPTSGPFVVTSADADRVELRRNPYALPAPLLSGMELRLASTPEAALADFQAGQVDAVVASTPAQRAMAARAGGVRLQDSTTFRFVDLLFNERVPGLDDPAVRHAIAGAIDRHRLIAASLGGDAKPQTGAVPAGIAWAAGAAPEQPASALAAHALDAGGWLVGAGGIRQRGGVPLSFILTVPDAPPIPAVAHELGRQLAGIGVGVSVRPVPAATFLAGTLVPHTFELAAADWDNGPDPDVSSFWRSNAAPPQGYNVAGGPADPFLDQALDSLATVSDPRARRDAAHDVEARLADDAPAVFLYAPISTFATSGRLGHATVPPVGGAATRYAEVTGWTLAG